MKLHATAGRQGLAARSGSLRELSMNCELMSNSNIAQFRDLANSSRMKVYVIPNRNKTGACAEAASTTGLRSGTEIPSFASGFTSAYHQGSMLMLFRRLWMAALAVLFVCSLPLYAGDSPEIMPLSQIKPGMKGVAYTIFEGDQVEKMDLVVLGTLHNALGPKQDVILVKLVGEKVEHTGVVAGMSGSPVYFDGKLAGALSLKLGVFTKEAIGGVTPIENMLDVEKAAATPASPMPGATPANPASITDTRIPLPENYAHQTGAGGGQFLVPIETPLISTGLYPETLAQFGKQLSAWGITAMAGGTTPPSPEDANLKPGDMVGMELVRGDLSIAPGCTVTLVEADRILACG